MHAAWVPETAQSAPLLTDTEYIQYVVQTAIYCQYDANKLIIFALLIAETGWESAGSIYRMRDRVEFFSPERATTPPHAA